jgi:hypothetical protein
MTAENGGALRGPEPPSEGQATTNNNDRISRRREYPTPPPMPAENNSNEENESTRAEHHRRIERRHWTFEKIVAAVALIVTAAAMWGAIASAIYASRALIASQQAANEAARQADAAYSDQRPWLRVNLTLIGFRILENADSEITYHFEVKNVGRSPARNIRPRFEASAVTNNNAINSIPDQKRQCDLAKKDAVQASFPGAILFAGENAAEVAGALNLASNGRAIISHDTYPVRWPAPPGRFTLQIVGCFDYTQPSGEHGQTEFTYNLSRNVNGIPTMFSSITGAIPVNGIFFERDFFSGGYFQ